MRRTLAWLAVVGCGGGSARQQPVEPGAGPASVLADEDAVVPPYGKPELQRALFAERAADATGQRVVAELEARGEGPEPRQDPAGADRLHVARADLEVRRRFIASLEACEALGLACPPRLDDPPWAFDPDPDGPPVPPKLNAPLRFDLGGWRTIAAELHGRACACRTIACVDSMGVAIDQLELRPMPEVQGDEIASLSITRARQCLFRLRGKQAFPRVPARE